MENEAGTLIDPVTGQFRILVMHQTGDPSAVRGVYYMLDGCLVFWAVVLIRESQRDAHIIGTDASMLIQEVVNAMRVGLTVRGITQSIYVHPALPEVVQRAFGALDV